MRKRKARYRITSETYRGWFDGALIVKFQVYRRSSWFARNLLGDHEWLWVNPSEAGVRSGLFPDWETAYRYCYTSIVLRTKNPKIIQANMSEWRIGWTPSQQQQRLVSRW